jgi:putative DNA methylase
LFTNRQVFSLLTISQFIAKIEHADVKNLLSLALDRVASRSSSLCLWRYQADQEKVEHIFGRQALPVVWDFAEAVVTSSSTGSFSDAVEVVAGASESLVNLLHAPGQTQRADARAFPLPSESASVWFTDPPYYDAVPYAELSDFFYVWLKRTQLENPLLRDAADPTNPLTPKSGEIVQDETKFIDGRPKDRTAFESMMGDAFAEGHRILRHDGIASVVFAHKTTEGWEALLSGMVRAGWTITGSWPIATEMKNRLS